MKNLFWRAFACAVLIYASPDNPVLASTIGIVRNNDTAMETVYGIRDDTGTYGSDLAGAEITAYYADGSSEQITWQSDALTFTEPDGQTWSTIDGSARGQDIDLRMTWDGFEVYARNLLRFISIDLRPSGAVFDTTDTFDFDYEGNPTHGSTLGSDFGFEFGYYSEFASLAGHTKASYSGVVNLSGEEAIGDLYTTMMVDFSELSTNGVLGNVAFRSDIDVLRYSSDISPVPLPSSMSLFLIGLCGLGLQHRLRAIRQL